MDLAIWILVFLGSLAVLIKSSDVFVSAAEKIGLAFRLSPFLVGAIILAFGTSIPELVTSIYAVIAETSEIVVGNVVGSNIANVLLVLGSLGVAGAMGGSGKLVEIHPKKIKIELFFFVISAVLFSFFIWDGQIAVYEIAFLLAGLGAFLTLIIKQTTQQLPSTDDNNQADTKGIAIQGVLLLLSVVGIFFSAKYTIDAIINLSDLLNLPNEVIALSAVALGTSLPELMVSVMAVRKGQGDMAVGNILGSNIFNIFTVMSISRLFGELEIPVSILQFSLPIMLLATLSFFWIVRDKRLKMGEGIVLLVAYLLYNLELYTGWLNSLIYK